MRWRPPASALLAGADGGRVKSGGQTPPAAAEQRLRLGCALLRSPTLAPPSREQVLTSKSS